MPRKPTKKQIDKQIEQIYYRNVNGRQIKVTDIGKVFAAGHAAHERGEPIEPAVLAAMNELCNEPVKLYAF